MGYEAIETGKRAWRIEDTLVRFFLFEGEERALLVDTGLGTGDVKAFVESLTSLPVMLVNTHSDPDHTGGNAAFEDIYLHPSEFSAYSARTAGNQKLLPLPEGATLDIGGRIFEAILIPGHTPGSIALLDRANRFIITGDTLSSAPVFLFGEGRNIHEYISSLKKLESMADAFDTIFPSHGEFPLDAAIVTAQREAAERLLAGELPPQEPFFDVPAKMYTYGPCAFFYD